MLGGYEAGSMCAKVSLMLKLKKCAGEEGDDVCKKSEAKCFEGFCRVFY